MSRTVSASGVDTAGSEMRRMQIERRTVGPTDVDIDIAYCGMCHTDLHFLNNDWGNSLYPMVPGHEIVGFVRAVGSGVTRHRVGDRVAVGCMVDSCRSCKHCRLDLQQYCEKGATLTYNAPEPGFERHTFGGYSDGVVVDERFVLRLPESLSMAGAAPLACAGVTAYSPLKRWGAGKGKRVAVVGLGGVGHIAVKIAAAMGATVTVLTGQRDKLDDGLRLGASESVLSSDLASRTDLAGRFDIVLDTAAAPHEMHPYMALLGLDGVMVMVGLPAAPATMSAWDLVLPRRMLTGSLIGGIAETQETLDFCASHGVECDVELVRSDDIETARRRLERGDVRYRFVLDASTFRAGEGARERSRIDVPA